MSSILIVDDERDIRELIGDILRDEGFQIRLAANSDECMAAVNAEPPALMILDIWLKDSRMDGIDILKRTKRDNPDVPVVIISGHGNIEIAVAAIKQAPTTSSRSPSTSTSSWWWSSARWRRRVCGARTASCAGATSRRPRCWAARPPTGC